MSLGLFVFALLVSALGPVLAIRYMRVVLERSLRNLCDAEGGAEFWIRCAYLMATSGTLFMTLAFLSVHPSADALDVLQYSLMFTLAGVFVTVGCISFNVMTQLRRQLAQKGCEGDGLRRT